MRVLIVNEAEFPQPFPALELRFSELNGVLVAGHRFQPREYLAGDARDLELDAGRHASADSNSGSPTPVREAVNYESESAVARAPPGRRLRWRRERVSCAPCLPAGSSRDIHRSPSAPQSRPARAHGGHHRCAVPGSRLGGGGRIRGFGDADQPRTGSGRPRSRGCAGSGSTASSPGLCSSPAASPGAGRGRRPPALGRRRPDHRSQFRLPGEEGLPARGGFATAA